MTGQVPWYDDGAVRVFHGDSRLVLKYLPDASIDSVVTDPPYELTAGGNTGFMGARWDGTGVAFDPAVWAECLRVLKPGGHLAAFGAPRTYHRMAVAIEDAGFVIGDSLMWVRSGNMPKSKNVSVAIDKEANRQGIAVAALKARLTVLFDVSGKTRAQIDRECGFRAANYLTTVSDGKRPDPWTNVLPPAKKWRVMKQVLGADTDPLVNADLDRFFSEAEREILGWRAVRPEVAFGTSGPDRVPVTAPASPEATEWEGWGTALASAYEPVVLARRPREGTVAQNVLAYRTGGINIDGCRVPYETDDRTIGAGRKVVVPNTSGRWPSNLLLSHTMADDGTDACADACAEGCPVAEMNRQSGTLTSGILAEHHHRAPKEAGVLGAYAAQPGARGYGDTGGASRFFPVFRYEAKAPQNERPEVDGVRHISVKPLSMMCWIVKLLTPPGGTVLDLFAGTGTTGEACVVEGFRCILIESEQAHLPLIRQRLDKPIQPDLFGGAA